MIPELTLPITVILPLLTALATLAAAWGIMRFQSHQHDQRIMVIEARINVVRDELQAFKLEASQRFVTDDVMSKLEERVIGAIDRLADRLDRLIEARVAGRKVSP